MRAYLSSESDSCKGSGPEDVKQKLKSYEKKLSLVVFKLLIWSFDKKF